MTQMLNATQQLNKPNAWPNGWNRTVCAGAAADLTVPGIAVGDVILSAMEVAATTVVFTDRTADCTISAANTVTCSVDSTGDVWIIDWWDTGA